MLVPSCLAATCKCPRDQQRTDGTLLVSLPSDLANRRVTMPEIRTFELQRYSQEQCGA